MFGKVLFGLHGDQPFSGFERKHRIFGMHLPPTGVKYNKQKRTKEHWVEVLNKNILQTAVKKKHTNLIKE